MLSAVRTKDNSNYTNSVKEFPILHVASMRKGRAAQAFQSEPIKPKGLPFRTTHNFYFLISKIALTLRALVPGPGGIMGNERKEEENLTEYEKQRLLRIKDNQARLEALGLPALVSSVRDDVSKQPQAKSKGKKKETDPDEEEEYRLSDEEDDGNDEEEEETMENRSSEEEMPSSTSSSGRRKGKSTISSNECKSSKGSRLKRVKKDGDLVDDDIALAQAIAMSLGEPVQDKNSGEEMQNKAVRKSKSTAKYEKLNKKPSKSRIQLCEDEVIGLFFSFDEVGKGYITAYDIEKMAIVHDFTWTDGEISKMVRCFDSNGDRKLNLEDFRSIVSRCHMLQEP